MFFHRPLLLLLLLLPILSPLPAEAKISAAPKREISQLPKTEISEIPGSPSAKTKVQERSGQKFSLIKSENRKNAVLNLIEHISSINKKRVVKMNSSIKKMETVLKKIEAEEEELKKAGKDTTLLLQSLGDAKNAILLTKEALVAQGEKEYTISFESENTLKSGAGKTIKQLQQDLQTINKALILSKDSLKEAAKDMRTLKKGGVNGSESTESTESTGGGSTVSSGSGTED